jgi:hypothetical protein
LVVRVKVETMLSLIKSSPVHETGPKVGDILLLVQTHSTCYLVPGEFSTVQEAKDRIPAIIANGVEVTHFQSRKYPGQWEPVIFYPEAAFETNAFFVGPMTISQMTVVTVK